MAFDIDPSTIPKLPTKDAYIQATAYRFAGYPLDLTAYNLVADYSASNSVTARAAADAIIAAGVIWG